jgi:hypothetical protein
MKSPLEIFSEAAVGSTQWHGLSPSMRETWSASMAYGFEVFLDPPTDILDRCIMAMQRADEAIEDGAGFADLARACLAALVER